jgi:SAM-dependent methyltransferase/uncharacterized protein YbaR (Trm112 family)
MIDIYKIIACPICKTRLKRNDKFLECPVHGKFPITNNGIPILFSESNRRTFEDGEKFYGNEERNKRIVFLKRKLFRKPKLYFGESLHDKLKKKYIIEAPNDHIILNIGSGHESTYKQENFVNLDIYPHNNTHVAGDAHNLPFLDNSVNVAWLSAVLEHIQQPFLVMNEVYRVLKPGGYVLISVPFLQYLHGSPYDYFRYTKYGLRSVCNDFAEVKAGASYTGPMGTLIQLASVLPEAAFNNKVVKNGLSVIISWLLSPLLVFDLFLKTNNEVLSGGVCYLGKKE